MNMNTQYYISLGTGYNQLPLILAAKKKNLFVIGVDQDDTSPGMEHCDLKILESIYNFRKIYYKINSLFLPGKIIGGYAASYGEALLSWGYISEKLQLHGLNRPLLERLQDKGEVRAKLAEVLEADSPFAQPSFLFFNGRIGKKSLNEIGFPLIVKPRTGHGKKNIMEIPNEKEFKKVMTKKNLTQKKLAGVPWILEEKVEGDEITVIGFVQNFQFIPIAITDKITSSKAPFIELEHRFPSQHQSLLEKIKLAHNIIIDAFQITDTPLVSEWKVRDNELLLIEVSPQIPGEFLGNVVIPKALSYDYYGNLLELTLGNPVDEKMNRKKAKKALVKYHPQILSDAQINEIKREADMYKPLNLHPHSPPRSNADRFAVSIYIG